MPQAVVEHRGPGANRRKGSAVNKSTRTCSFEDCGRGCKARGLCDAHYRQNLRGQSLRPLRPLTLQERFWAKVNKDAPGGCWEWTAGATSKGYGAIGTGGRVKSAHRFSWELTNGPIPDGMAIDHRCANRRCVNPGHLRVLTVAQNNQHLTGPQKNTTTGVRGVYWNKEKKSWSVKVGLDGLQHWGGYHSTLHEAEAAAKALRAQLHTYDDHEEWVGRGV